MAQEDTASRSQPVLTPKSAARGAVRSAPGAFLGWLLRRPSPLAVRVAQSLRDERDAWRTEDRYVWTHLTGVSIWVANGREGLGISSGHNRPAEPRQGALGAADRRHIWRIVKVIWDENEERTRRQALSALSPAHIVGERRK